MAFAVLQERGGGGMEEGVSELRKVDKLGRYTLEINIKGLAYGLCMADREERK